MDKDTAGCRALSVNFIVGDVIKFRLHNAIERSQLSAFNQLKYLSEYDALTGIYNKEKFFQATRELLDAHPGEQFAFIRADIDRFQLINSIYGADEGDCLLKYMAENLKQCGQKGRYTYGRIDADVFAVCRTYSSKEGVIAGLEASTEYIKAYNRNFDIVPIYGVYYLEDLTLPITEMLDRATLAAKTRKGNYVNTVGVYVPEMSRKLEQEQEIINQMVTALEQKQFLIYLQPKYSMDTNLPAGAEALARWQHPTKGLVPPSLFIPVFEKNGFIAKLDYYIWEEVCKLLQLWIRQGLDPAPISVNISRVNLYNPNTAQIINNLVQKYAIPPKLLQLELTESAYMVNPQMMEYFTKELHKMGFTVLMDDFGKGYSSLSILKNIQVDILKIDMQFFEDTQVHGRGENIIASVIRMAKWLNIPTVAEGVEKAEQVDFLRSVGCDYVQGYYFACPMPVDIYQKLVDGDRAIDVESTRMKDAFDVDKLWSTDSEIEILFFNATQANCLYEFDGEKLEAIRVNKLFTKVFGFDPNVKSKTPIDFVLPEDRGNVIEAFQICVQETKNEECVYRRKGATGKVLWVLLKLQYICAVGGKHIILGHLTDITEQKILEFKLNRFRDAGLPESGHGRKMLIIDDMEDSVALLGNIFQKDCQILTASNGEEGLCLMEENKDQLDLILLDMAMPGMDGTEFLNHKNEHADTAGIPVIVISPDGGCERQINMLDLGVNDYITKPFVPEIVARRVRNVLEYSSRFTAMVGEYHKAEAKMVNERLFEINQIYTVKEVRMLMMFLTPVFDMIRLVDPTETALVTLTEDGNVHRERYHCFDIWKKETRCENCSSICGMREACRMTKYEFLQNNVFYVVSNPIVIEDCAGTQHSLVLEIASHVSNHIMLGKHGEKTVGQLIEDTQKKIYTDELTGAYNRRYFREMLFAHRGQTGIVQGMALIMLDMQDFKQINDRYGHAMGDDVIMRLAKVLIHAVRQNDSVIRYGGDEFLVILTNCTEEQVKGSIARLRRAICEIRYGESEKLTAWANFGYAYTEQFDFRRETLEKMIQAADMAMYQEKRRKSTREAGEKP